MSIIKFEIEDKTYHVEYPDDYSSDEIDALQVGCLAGIKIGAAHVSGGEYELTMHKFVRRPPS